MTPYERVVKAVATASRRLVGDLDPARPEIHALWEAIRDSAVGVQGQPNPVLSARTPEERFIQDVMLGFQEIDDSFKNLQLIEEFISKFPHRGTTITRSAHLRYHFENYLHEFYILKLRLKDYAVAISRKYRKDARHPEIEKRTEELTQDVIKVMGGIDKTRGSHVHVRRFRHPEFDQLATLDTFISYPLDPKLTPLLKRFYVSEYRRIRKAWRGYVVENNRAIRLLLDLFAVYLLAVVFTGSNDELAPPSSIRRTR